jgi:hypothetical protein
MIIWIIIAIISLIAGAYVIFFSGDTGKSCEGAITIADANDILVSSGFTASQTAGIIKNLDKDINGCVDEEELLMYQDVVSKDNCIYPNFLTDKFRQTWIDNGYSITQADEISGILDAENKGCIKFPLDPTLRAVYDAWVYNAREVVYNRLIQNLPP